MFTLTFTGDVHLGDAYADSHAFDPAVLQACRASDGVVFNVEGPITALSPRRGPGFLLHSHPRGVRVLESLGKVVFDLANNHILDHGPEGLSETIGVAAARGWPCVGAGETLGRASAPVMFGAGSVTVGVLGVCGPGVSFAGKESPGVFGDRPAGVVRRRIRELKTRVRWVVVVYHGGEEFNHVPLPGRRRKLLRYARWGADVVVAHHAHCVQRYERVGGKLVFYGLGNLVFDLDHHKRMQGTDESVLLVLTFSEHSVDFRPLFTRNDRVVRRVLAAPTNEHFREITRCTYPREWGAEAASRLRSFWSSGHEKPAGKAWGPRGLYVWRKLRRAAGLLWVCISDRHGLTRPYIVGGVLHHLRRLCRPCTGGQVAP